jgi:four helix bundle protein
MEYQFSFEKLVVWQSAKELAKYIYIDTKKFPQEELYGIISQMRRSSVSVCSNIAEGSSRKTPKEQARFYQISYSSLMELMNQLILSESFGYLSEEDLLNYRKKIMTLSHSLNRLHEKVKMKQ